MASPSSVEAFSRRMARLIRGCLLLLVAGVVLGGLLVAGTRRPEPLPVASSALEARALRLPASPERASNDLVFRPLFWQTRRPIEEPRAAPQVAPVQVERLDDVVLVGLFDTGTASGAILKLRDQHQRVAVGERVEGWELREVTVDSAVFTLVGRNNEQPLRLVLERNRND